jgi:GxxExxY protein
MQKRDEEQDPLTREIIGCAIEVHKALGPGLLENAYHAAMCIALTQAGFSIEREKTFPVMFRGVRIAEYRPDLIVDNAAVVEIKAVEQYHPIFTAKMLAYLRITGLQRGLILNFNRPILIEGVTRVSL